jgi:Cu/Ag efflux protein CusF
MFHHSGCIAPLLLLIAASASAQDIQRGTIKTVDAEKKSITVTVGDKDRTFTISDETQIRSANGGKLKDGLKDSAFQVGSAVDFFAREQGGKTVLMGLRPATGNAPAGKVGQNPVNGILRGRIKKIDIDQLKLTLNIDGKDRELTLTETTQVLGSNADTLKERMKDFREGLDTDFRELQRDGKQVVQALRLVTADVSGRPAPNRNPPPPPPADLKPLTDLGPGEYRGHPGGLYPQGRNTRPQSHEDSGRRLAAQVQPLDRGGQPAPDGRIVLLSIGMSNTSQSSTGFRRALREASGINPRVVLVDGAQGGMTAAAIQDPEDTRTGARYWTTVDERLRAEGVTRNQVQAIWIKQADAAPSSGFPAYARTLEGELAKIVQILPKRFPNVKLCYLSSRTYGGYAKTNLNPEPYAYESGFSVKWLIERQIRGDQELNFNQLQGEVRAPWLSWGAYLWTNGNQPRSDDIRFEPADFTDNDGTHQSPSGQTKVGRLLLDFFQTDSTTKPWFVKAD